MKQRKPPKLTLTQRVAIFKALAHPTRLQIVAKLADGEQCVCVLLEMFDIDFSTISRHLAVLRNAGILTTERRGKNIYYRLRCPCLLKLFDCLDETFVGQ